MFVDFSARLLEESSLRRVTVADGCLHRRAESNFCFVPVAQTQCPSTSGKTFPEKVLVVSNHALFIVQEQSLPHVRLHACSIVDRRWIRNNKGPAATRRILQITAHAACARSSVFGRLPAAANARLKSLFRPSCKRKPFLNFVFRIWSRRIFIWSQ